MSAKIFPIITEGSRDRATRAAAEAPSRAASAPRVPPGERINNAGAWRAATECLRRPGVPLRYAAPLKAAEAAYRG